MKPHQGQLHGDPRCPVCKNKADGYTKPGEGAMPRTGDLVVCAYCAMVGEYELTDDKVSIRQLSVVELVEIFLKYPDLKKEIDRVKEAVRRVMHERQTKDN